MNSEWAPALWAFTLYAAIGTIAVIGRAVSFFCTPKTWMSLEHEQREVNR